MGAMYVEGSVRGPDGEERLENLGVMLDPYKREIVPMRMLLISATP